MTAILAGVYGSTTDGLLAEEDQYNTKREDLEDGCRDCPDCGREPPWRWRAAREAIESRKQFAINRGCCDFNVLQALRFTARRSDLAASPTRPRSARTSGCIGKMFPGVTNGFFLDVGSGHGTIGSNTKALEDLGWTGICIDPFPTHMEGRTCRMEKVVVSSAAGQVVKFHTHIGARRDRRHARQMEGRGGKESRGRVHHDHARRGAGGARTRPSFIHFLSLDIEGAELEALKRRAVRQVSIRRDGHRTQRRGAEAHRPAEVPGGEGLPRVHSYKQDDFYAPR